MRNKENHYIINMIACIGVASLGLAGCDPTVPTPAGAVVSFDLKSCPAGWSNYKKAYGRFVRGIDPEEDRVAGSIQGDMIKGHTHEANMEIGAEPTTGSAKSKEAAGAHGRIGKMYTSKGLVRYAGGSETRPKNVGLLYCIKKKKPKVKNS